MGAVLSNAPCSRSNRTLSALPQYAAACNHIRVSRYDARFRLPCNAVPYSPPRLLTLALLAISIFRISVVPSYLPQWLVASQAISRITYALAAKANPYLHILLAQSIMVVLYTYVGPSAFGFAPWARSSSTVSACSLSVAW